MINFDNPVKDSYEAVEDSNAPVEVFDVTIRNSNGAVKEFYGAVGVSDIAILR